MALVYFYFKLLEAFVIQTKLTFTLIEHYKDLKDCKDLNFFTWVQLRLCAYSVHNTFKQKTSQRNEMGEG